MKHFSQNEKNLILTIIGTISCSYCGILVTKGLTLLCPRYQWRSCLDSPSSYSSRVTSSLESCVLLQALVQTALGGAQNVHLDGVVQAFLV